MSCKKKILAFPEIIIYDIYVAVAFSWFWTSDIKLKRPHARRGVW
jgi:hypothetical protein